MTGSMREPRLRNAVIIAGFRGDDELIDAARDHGDPEVRSAALGALERRRRLSPAALAAALHDPAATVRRRAAELAARHRDVDLLGALDDSDPTVIEIAIWACGEREQVDDATLERLIELTTTDEDALVREAGAAALGAIGDSRGLAAILTACRDRPAVRRRAVLALAAFIADDDSGDVERAIDHALGDRDWQVRQAAEDLRRAVSTADTAE